MKAPDRPDNETQRLDELYRMDILDTPPEHAFDDITRLAAIVCGTMFSTVSLIDEERQWFKSIVGPLGVSETDREVSFCGHAILGSDIFVVEDALADDRFRDNPVVTAGPMIRFYAGVPLITQGGAALGTLCVFDPKPGSLSDSQREGLVLLAKKVSEQIEQRMANTLLDHMGALLDVSSSYVIMFDPFSERVSYVNPALATQLDDTRRRHARPLVQQLFPDLEYERFLTPDSLKRIDGERRQTTRLCLPSREDGQAELRILPHLKAGRHTCLLLFSDRSELNRSRRQFDEARSNVRVLSKVAMQSRNGVVITDPEERIQWVNKSFESLSGYSANEMIGRRPGDFLQGPETSEKDRQRIRKHLDDGEPVVQEILNYSKSGQPYWVEVYIEPIRDDDGRITHFVASQSNITHRKEHDMAIRASRTAAERANRAKSQFLANISHELRTPLNGIMGTTERLLEQVPESLTDVVNTLDKSSRHLLSLLNELLDLSHLETGKLVLNETPFQLNAVMQEVDQLFQSRAEAVGTKLQLDLDNAPDDWLMGDPVRLKQVLINLVNNAIKFTPQGQVTLSARALAADNEPGDYRRFQLAVTDNGPGIPTQDQARIFESFEQLDNTRARVHGGSGLGLAISRQILRAMGTDITLESTVGAGSRFAFDIRLPITTRPHERPGNLDAESTPRRVSHALVIDDNEVNRSVLESLLLRLGLPTVHTAGSARRGLALLENLQPDIVFVDLHMPTMDGFEFVSRLREEFAARGRPLPPLIACTADAADDQKQACLEAGFDGHLAKPVSADSVKDTLRQLNLGPSEPAAQPPVNTPPRADAAHSAALQSPPEAGSLVTSAGLKRSFHGNEDLLEDFLSLLQENLPTHMERVDAAIALGETVTHYDAAHSIKGLVGYFHDSDLLARASQLETAMKAGDSQATAELWQVVKPVLERLIREIRSILKTL